MYLSSRYINMKQGNDKSRHVDHLEVLVTWQHRDLVSVDADHFALKVDQLALAHLHHVARSKVMNNF